MSVTALRSQPTNIQKFGPLMGPLYDALRVENGVRTPSGIGTLQQAFTCRCLVSLMREKDGPRGYAPMREYRPEDVEVIL